MVGTRHIAWLTPGPISMWRPSVGRLATVPFWSAKGVSYRWRCQPRKPLSPSDVKLMGRPPAIRMSVRACGKLIRGPAWFRAPRVFLSRAWER